ncbi:MAG: YlbF family regulator [Clostridia bacterium]|nr:YlbF family regulator [Clostridia bacterium]
MDIFEKAHELGQMLADSKEFKALNDAKAAQDADGEASLVLMNYNRNREQLIKQASEPGISNEKMQEIRNKMEKEVEKLNSNKSIADFMEAMQGFNDIMEQVNAIISSYISPNQDGGCGGNCSSCGGCH